MKAWKALGAWWATAGLLALLGALELASRSAAERLGVYRAFDVYMRGPGAVVGTMLLLSAASGLTRLRLSRGAAPLYALYLGASLLAAGLFVSSAVRRELMIALEPGQTVRWAEDAQAVELALTDETDPETDKVWAISEKALRRSAELRPPLLPLRVRVHEFVSRPRKEQTVDAAADVEIAEDKLSSAGGRFQLSLRQQGARFEAGGRRYSAELRRRRRYLPFALTLEDVRPDLDPVTGIPRSLTSRLLLSSRGPEQASTGKPLRVDGLAFYQAGVGPDGRLSILELVDERARPFALASWALVLLGALGHGTSLLYSRREARHLRV